MDTQSLRVPARKNTAGISRAGKTLRTTIVAAVIAMLTVFAPGAALSANAVTVTNPGPLYQIETMPDLKCRVEYTGDAVSQFYGGDACGTLIAFNGVLYAPTGMTAGNNNLGNPWTPWEPQSQTLSGTGTVADPFVIVTTATAGPLTVMQTDSYVTGDNAYQTDISVTSTEDGPITIYRAADCYLQNSDYGLSEFDPIAGAPTCRARNDDGTKGPRIQQFIPLTDGSNYYAGQYVTMWGKVGSMNPLPNYANPANAPFLDTAMAISWTKTATEGTPVTASLLTNFSPLGVRALPTTVAPDLPSVPAGEVMPITATIYNPNVAPTQPLPFAEWRFTMPAGVTYVAGSVVGANEPTRVGDVLTFTGAGPLAHDATKTLTFKVTSLTAGTFPIDSSGTLPGGPILGSSTQVVFTDRLPVTTTITPAPASVVAGTTTTLSVEATNTSSAAADGTTFTVTLPAGLQYVAGSTSGVTEPTVTGQTLVFDGGDLAGHAALPFTFDVLGDVAGSYTVPLTGASTSEGATVAGSSTSVEVTAVPPVTTTIAANPAAVIVGSTSTVSASATNTATTPSEAKLVVPLPAGVTYVAGSTTGLAEPTVSGSTLTFAAGTIPAGDTVSFAFRVTGMAGGTHVVELSGTSATPRVSVTGSSTTLQVNEKPAPLPITTTLAVAPESVVAGDTATVTATATNTGTDTADATLVVTLPAGVSYVAGSTQGAGEPTITGTTLTFTGTANARAAGSLSGIAGGATVTITFDVSGDAVGSYTLTLTGSSATAGVAVVGSETPFEVTEKKVTPTTKPPITTPSTPVAPSPAAPKPATLPATGSEGASATAIVGGGLLLAIGGVLIARRRARG